MFCSLFGELHPYWNHKSRKIRRACALILPLCRCVVVICMSHVSFDVGYSRKLHGHSIPTQYYRILYQVGQNSLRLILKHTRVTCVGLKLSKGTNTDDLN